MEEAKVANKVDDSSGIVDGESKKFQRKGWEVNFDATSAGITASFVMPFPFKANTDSMNAVKSTITVTISMNLEREFTSATGLDVKIIAGPRE